MTAIPIINSVGLIGINNTTYPIRGVIQRMKRRPTMKCYKSIIMPLLHTGQNCKAFFTELTSNFNPDIIKIQNTHTLEKYVFDKYFPIFTQVIMNIPGCGNKIPIAIARIRKIGK